MNLKKIIVQVWRDPVWGKVMAAGIIAAIGFVLIKFRAAPAPGLSGSKNIVRVVVAVGITILSIGVIRWAIGRYFIRKKLAEVPIPDQRRSSPVLSVPDSVDQQSWSDSFKTSKPLAAPPKSNGKSDPSHVKLDMPITGSILRDQLPEFLFANTLEELRAITHVRQPMSEENQLTLGELPNGIFGYVEPHALDGPYYPRLLSVSSGGRTILAGNSIEEFFQLNSSLHLRQKPSFGDWVEVHKSGNGNMYVVVYITAEDRILLQNPLRGQSGRLALSLTSRGNRSQMIAIPRERLEWWRNRELGNGEVVCDARVS